MPDKLPDFAAGLVLRAGEPQRSSLHPETMPQPGHKLHQWPFRAGPSPTPLQIDTDLTSVAAYTGVDPGLLAIVPQVTVCLSSSPHKEINMKRQYLVAASILALLSGGALAQNALPPIADDAPVFGSQIMTQEERVEHRDKMRAAKTLEEREQVRAENHTKMLERAKERGVTLPEELPARGGMGLGGGMGPGKGPGAGMGPGGGMGPGAGPGRGGSGR